MHPHGRGYRFSVYNAGSVHKIRVIAVLITYTLKQSAGIRVNASANASGARNTEIYKWFNNGGNRKINPIPRDGHSDELLG